MRTRCGRNLPHHSRAHLYRPHSLEHKSARLELKADEDGVFRCVFATMNVVDKQGDVTAPGAFEEGAIATVSAFMHSSWLDQLPVGEGAIRTVKDEAGLDGSFWLDTPGGDAHYKVCKRSTKLEWSYGFDAELVSYDEKELEKFPGAFRILKKVKVYEVSPVLIGAGIGTHTEYVKSATLDDQRLAALVSAEAVGQRWKALVSVLRKEGRAISKERRERIATDSAALREYGKGSIGIADDLDLLLAETDPGKAQRESVSLRSTHLRHETRLRELRGALVMGRSN